MKNVEVHGHGGGKIVIVIEGTSTGMMGECLSRISLFDGVISANMVFEHIETEGA
jgi:nitrate reductase NapD